MRVHPRTEGPLNLLGLPHRWAAGKDNFVRHFRLASGNPSLPELELLANTFRDVEETFGVEWERLGPGSYAL